MEDLGETSLMQSVSFGEPTVLEGFSNDVPPVNRVAVQDLLSSLLATPRKPRVVVGLVSAQRLHHVVAEAVSDRYVKHKTRCWPVYQSGYLEHVLVVGDDHGLTKLTRSLHDAHQVISFDVPMNLTVVVLEQPLLEYLVTYRLATGTVGFVGRVEFLAEVMFSREH